MIDVISKCVSLSSAGNIFKWTTLITILQEVSKCLLALRGSKSSAWTLCFYAMGKLVLENK